MRLLFIESPAFSRYRGDYLDDESFAALQGRLAADPAAGSVIAGAGGLRKLRWRDARRGKGKRGGLRVVYLYVPEEAAIWLMALCDKDEKPDRSPAERRLLRRALDAELAARRRRH